MEAVRILRAKRLIDIRQRAVTEAQQELALAHHARAAAELAVKDARERWEADSEETRASSTIVAGELEGRHVRNRQLYDAWRHADRKRIEAALLVEERRDAVTVARAEQRKLEVWRDKLVEQGAVHRAAVERAETDALAARTMRRAR